MVSIKKQWIIFYGILQSFHLVFLIVFLSNTSWIVGFLNNASDWNEQFINMFKAISVLDLINAFFSLVFVYLFLKNDKRANKLGVIVLSVSVYSALIFGLGIYWNQLHIGNDFILSAFSLPFMSVFYIWVKFVFNLYKK